MKNNLTSNQKLHIDTLENPGQVFQYLQSETDEDEWVIKGWMLDLGQDIAHPSLKVIPTDKKVVEGSASQSVTSQDDVIDAHQKAMDRTESKGLNLDTAAMASEWIREVPRSPSGDPQLSIGDDLTGTPTTQEHLDKGSNAIRIALDAMKPQKVESGDMQWQMYQDLLPREEELMSAYNESISDENWKIYKSDTGTTSHSLYIDGQTTTVEIPNSSLNREAWNNLVLKTDPAHEDYFKLLEYKRNPPTPIDPDVYESVTMTVLRDVSTIFSIYAGAVEGSIRLGVRAADQIAEAAGYEGGVEEYLADQDNLFSPGFSEAVAEAIMPDEVLVNGQPATISEELAYAMGTNLTEGLGLMGAAYIGQRADYALGLQDPEDESINLGFNFTTGSGAFGLLTEAGTASWTGGVVPLVGRITTYNRIIKNLSKTGLLNDAAKAAAKAALKAEQVKAVKDTFTFPIKIISKGITKPIEIAAAKTLGVELKLTEGVSTFLGGSIKADDPVAMAIAGFTNEPMNKAAGTYILDIMTRTQRDLLGIGSVDELRKWFKNNGFTAEEYDQFVTMAKSIGHTVDDAWIKGWPEDLINIETIAARRARFMTNNLPPSVRASLLGRESPLDVAMEIASMPGTTKTTKPLSAVANEMRTEALLQYTATKKVTDAMKSGNWDISNLEKLSNTLFTNPEVRAQAIQRVKDTIGKTVAEIMASGKAGGTGSDIVLTPEQSKRIFDYFIGDFRGKGHLGSGTWIEQVTASPYSQSTKEILLSIIAKKDKPFKFTNQHYQQLIEDALTSEAWGRGIPRKAIDEAIAALTAPGKASKIYDVATATLGFLPRADDLGNRFMQARTYANAFRPEELRSGQMRLYFGSIKDSLGISPAIPNSALDEASRIIRNHMGAGDEHYKYQIRIKRGETNPFTGEKYTQREAWIAVIMDEYGISSERTRREILLSEGKDLYKADDAVRHSDSQGDYDNFFTDYFTLVFGGQENISHTILSSGGKVTKDLRPLAPDEIMGLMDSLIEVSPIIREYRNQFRKAMAAGDLENSMNVIVGLHMEMQGKTLGQMLSLDDFKRLLQDSPNLGSIVARSGMSTPGRIEAYYEKAQHLTPYFKPDDTAMLQSHVYYQTRVSNGIEMGYDALVDMTGGSIFPSNRVLTMSAQSDAANRIWFTHELMERAGLQPSAKLINDFHLRLTGASIKKGIAGTIASGNNPNRMRAYRHWDELLDEFVEESIGARPQNNIPAETKWDVKAENIKKALDDAYINDSNSPYNKYWNSISDDLTPKHTIEYKENLLQSLENVFRRTRTIESGVLPTSRMPAEQALRMPMILDDASRLESDLNAALSLEKRGSAKSGEGFVQRYLAPKTAFEAAEIPHHLRKETQAAANKMEELEADLINIDNKMPPDTPKQTAARNAERGRVEAELQDLRDQYRVSPYILQGEDANIVDFMSYITGRVADQAKATRNYGQVIDLKNSLSYLTRVLQFSYRAAWNTNRFVKGSVLAGFYAINPQYLVMNEASAQLIISSTVGIKYAKPLNLKARIVVGYAHGAMPNAGSMVVVTHPVTGRVYRVADMAELAYSSSLSRGQANAELAGNFAEGFAKYAGSDPESLKALRRANSTSHEALTAINRLLGSAPQSVKDAWQYINRNILTTNMNLFNQLASASDLTHRLGVTAEALRLGKTHDEAIRLGQTALHDYNSLLPWEKVSIGRYVWFWTFARSQMLVTFRNLLENPNRVSLGAKLGRDWRKEEDKYRLPKEDYNIDRPIIAILDNKETEDQFIALGIKLPTVGAIKEMVEWLAPLAPFLDDNKSFQKASLEAIENYGHTIIGKGAPIQKGALEFFSGKQFKFGEVRDLSNYVDPNIIYMASQNPRLSEMLHGMVPMTGKDPDKISRKHMSFDGQVYEIATEQGKRNYAALLQAITLVGGSRLVNEYAPILYNIKNSAGYEERDLEQTPVSMTAGDPAWDAARVLFGVKFQPGSAVSIEQKEMTQEVRELNKINEVSQ